MKYFKFALHKAFFEKGYSLSHYLFKVIAVFGLTSQAMTSTFIMVLIYTLGCYIGGRWAYQSGLARAEIEVSNIYNLFVNEMRAKFK